MRLHIGPGNTYLPDWINVDIFSNVRADIYSSALALPYERETFDLIYACHVLEHFSRYMVLSALTHWRDLLKPDGILRLAVPDFGSICLHYMRNRDLKSLMGVLYGSQGNMLDVHCVVFDSYTLTEMLESIGFKGVREWDWRKTDHAEYDDYSQAYLPHMDKEKGMHMSLNLEAVK